MKLYNGDTSYTLYFFSHHQAILHQVAVLQVNSILVIELSLQLPSSKKVFQSQPTNHIVGSSGNQLPSLGDLGVLQKSLH